MDNTTIANTNGTYTATENQPSTVATSEPTPEPQKTPTVDGLKAQLLAIEAEKDKLKKAMDAACSDAARQKKEAQKWQEQYKSTLDEQKRKEFEAEEAHKQILAQLAEYKNKERVASYKAKLMSAGYDDPTASTMATALPDGVEDSFFEAQRTFLENTKQTIKTQTLNSQPSLSTGMPPTGSTTASADDNMMRSWFGLPTK